jgi:hypothetical protein
VQGCISLDRDNCLPRQWLRELTPAPAE